MKQKTTNIASGRKYGASFVRALKERAMLDPDAPNAIVFPSDCCYETHSPREACKKDTPAKHLRMEAVVSQLGGETSHLDSENVPIHGTASVGKTAHFFLRDCPMCGGYAVVREDNQDPDDFMNPRTYYYVECAYATCEVRTRSYESQEQAVEGWNRRVLATGGNYTANDSTFPTEVTFANGRKVGIAFDGDKPYLTVGRGE